MKNLSFLILILTVLVSCSNPNCNNSNPIFDNNLPDDQIYISELIKELKNYSDNAYFIENYQSDSAGKRLYIKIVGDSICAVGAFKIVEENSKLNSIIEARGVGYKGAELIGLKYSISDNQLVFEDVETIVD